MRITTEVVSCQETVRSTTFAAQGHGMTTGTWIIHNSKIRSFKAPASLCSKYDLPMHCVPFPRIPIKSKEAGCYVCG